MKRDAIESSQIRIAGPTRPFAPQQALDPGAVVTLNKLPGGGCVARIDCPLETP